MNKIDYGIDAAPFMRSAFAISGVLALIGMMLEKLDYAGWAIPFFVIGFVPLLLGTIMFFYGKYGKFKMRDYIISKINWRGDERVLDIGSGLGLLLNEVAKHLTAGKAIGIDIWSEKDLSNNSLANAWRNAELEGMKNKIEILTEDARKLNFADNSFDVIVSMLCIHNIEEAGGIEAACFEIARVLKTNGTAIIADYVPTHDYAKAFVKAGLTIKSSKSYFGIALGPMWMVEATK